jgi:hypothetical protein
MKILFILLLAAFTAAHAQVAASLNASVQNCAAGQSILFCGTLTNTGTAQVFLNNVIYSGTASGAVIGGSNAFYSNVPGILAPGQTYIGQLFCVALSGTAPAADYAGSVSVEGGTNIFATGDLADTPFTVLSPAVTLVASGSTAAEDGPVSGTFTITRTGGTEIPLPVTYSIGGTGVNGADYDAIASSGVIATGSSSTTVVITPIPDDIAKPNPTVNLTLSPSTLYNLGVSTADTVTILIKPVDAWRYANFGALANSPQAADAADWSGAGIPNLLAFALNINPLSPSPALLPAVSSGSNYLTLTYSPNPAASDVTYTVQASTDLIHWSTTNIQSTSNPPSAPPGSVSWLYSQPIGAAGCLFMRLQVTRTDN